MHDDTEYLKQEMFWKNLVSIVTIYLVLGIQHFQ